MARRTDPQAETYVDTSAFIAFLDRSDSYHALYRRLFAQPPRLVTSGLVIAEGHGWFLRRYDFNRALQFLNFLGELPVLVIEPFGPEAIAPARRLLSKFSDQPLTLGQRSDRLRLVDLVAHEELPAPRGAPAPLTHQQVSDRPAARRARRGEDDLGR